MDPVDLDEVDKEILRRLQDNARYTAVELAEAVGVSDNTVHNRMDRLEAADVITGYTATIDPERAGFEFVFLFTCTVRISERTRVADEIIGMSGVIQVTQLMTGQHNLLIRAVGRDDEDITRLAERIDGLQLEINDESLVRAEHTAALDFVKVTDDAAVE